VDFDSEREFSATNQIRLWYEGAAGEALRRVDVGNVSLATPAFRFVTSAIPANAFGVQTRLRDFDARDLPRLSFDFNADPGAVVNLYLRLNDGTVVIPLTAGQHAESGLVKLSAPTVAADGKWHSVEYDLLKALKETFPNSEALVIKELKIAAPFAEGTLQPGLNRRGDYFPLDDNLGSSGDGKVGRLARQNLLGF